MEPRLEDLMAAYKQAINDYQDVCHNQEELTKQLADVCDDKEHLEGIVNATRKELLAYVAAD